MLMRMVSARSSGMRRAILVAVLCGLGFLLLASESAHGLGIGESSFYSIRQSDCQPNEASDPVGVVFYGSQAHAAGAAAAAQAHTGWSVSGGGSQGLWVHQGNQNYSCRGTDYQRASGTFSRFHIRIWFVDATSNSSVRKSVGTPHHEDFVTVPPCGHAVDSNGPTGSGFDWGRRELSDEMWDGGHTGQQNEYWGNTINFKQCDGDYAGSNGVGVTIPINHAH